MSDSAERAMRLPSGEPDGRAWLLSSSHKSLLERRERLVRVCCVQLPVSLTRFSPAPKLNAKQTSCGSESTVTVLSTVLSAERTSMVISRKAMSIWNCSLCPAPPQRERHGPSGLVATVRVRRKSAHRS